QAAAVSLELCWQRPRTRVRQRFDDEGINRRLHLPGANSPVQGDAEPDQLGNIPNVIRIRSKNKEVGEYVIDTDHQKEGVYCLQFAVAIPVIAIQDEQPRQCNPDKADGSPNA